MSVKGNGRGSTGYMTFGSALDRSRIGCSWCESALDEEGGASGMSEKSHALGIMAIGITSAILSRFTLGSPRALTPCRSQYDTKATVLLGDDGELKLDKSADVAQERKQLWHSSKRSDTLKECEEGARDRLGFSEVCPGASGRPSRDNMLKHTVHGGSRKGQLIAPPVRDNCDAVLRQPELTVGEYSAGSATEIVEHLRGRSDSADDLTFWTDVELAKKIHEAVFVRIVQFFELKMPRGVFLRREGGACRGRISLAPTLWAHRCRSR